VLLFLAIIGPYMGRLRVRWVDTDTLSFTNQLFKRILRQYDGMRKRNAFMEGYKKTAPFSENLDEFDEARQVVADLISEYEAAEEADYLNPDMGDKATSAEADKRVG
jgi:tubulin gamma